MKRETKVVIGASIGALALICVPLLVAQIRETRETELLNRMPRAATTRFRNQTRGTTQVRIFFRVVEADTPGNQITPSARPDVVLTGEKAARLVRALHFEEKSGASVWRDHSGPYTGAIFGCTALEFMVRGKKLADLRVGLEYGGGRGARWYAPPTYIADSFLLPESRDYLERQLNHELSGMS